MIIKKYCGKTKIIVTQKFGEKMKYSEIIKKHWGTYWFLMGFMAGCQIVFWIYFFTVGNK